MLGKDKDKGSEAWSLYIISRCTLPACALTEMREAAAVTGQEHNCRFRLQRVPKRRCYLCRPRSTELKPFDLQTPDLQLP